MSTSTALVRFDARKVRMRLVAPVIVVFAFMAAMIPAVAHAGVMPQMEPQSISKLKGTVTLANGNFYGYTFAKGKLTDVKSSNEKVVAPLLNDTTLYLSPMKAGKATVSYKYKGKTRKVKIVVKKYVNPIKTLKLGNKNYAKLFKKSIYGRAAYKNYVGKRIKVVPATGWKLKSLRYAKTKKLKNGGKIPAAAVNTYPEGQSTLLIFLTMQNKKDGRLSEAQLLLVL